MHVGMWTVLASVCNQKQSWETFFGSTPRLQGLVSLCLWSDLIHFTQSQSINHMEIYVRIIARQWAKGAYIEREILLDKILILIDAMQIIKLSICFCVCVCVWRAPALCSYKSLLFLLLFKFKNLLAWSVSSDRWWLHQQLQHLLEIHYNCELRHCHCHCELWLIVSSFLVYSEKWDTVSVKAPTNFAVNLAHSPCPSLSLSLSFSLPCWPASLALVSTTSRGIIWPKQVAYYQTQYTHTFTVVLLCSEIQESTVRMLSILPPKNPLTSFDFEYVLLLFNNYREAVVVSVY